MCYETLTKPISTNSEQQANFFKKNIKKQKIQPLATYQLRNSEVLVNSYVVILIHIVIYFVVLDNSQSISLITLYGCIPII